MCILYVSTFWFRTLGFRHYSLHLLFKLSKKLLCKVSIILSTVPRYLMRTILNLMMTACSLRISYPCRILLKIFPSIYKFGLSVCLSVCLCPINVKTAEPIGPKFFVGHHVTTGKAYEWSKFQIFVSIKIRSSLNFWKFWKSTKFFVKIRELFLFCFTMYTKRTCSQLI